MCFFACFNFFAFKSSPYYILPSSSSSSAYYQGGFLGLAAFAKALNPTEIIQGLVLAVRYMVADPGTQAGHDGLPLQRGWNNVGSSAPPAYYMPPQEEQYQGSRGYEGGAKGTDPIEYGRV